MNIYERVIKDSNGLVARDGKFIKTSDKSFETDEQLILAKIVKELSRNDPKFKTPYVLMKENKNNIPNMEYYLLGDEINYKMILVDFYGYCYYRCCDSDSLFSEILIPNEDICGNSITSNQYNTLEKLVYINNNSTSSLRLINKVLRK